MDSRVVICTSSTRPSSGERYEGLVVFETDTKMLLVWDGSKWAQVRGPVPYARLRRTTDQSIPDNTLTQITSMTVEEDSTGGVLTSVTDAIQQPASMPGLWIVHAGVVWQSNSIGVRTIRLFGSNNFREDRAAALNSRQHFTRLMTRSGTDMILDVLQSSGGALNASSGAGSMMMQAAYIGDIT